MNSEDMLYCEMSPKERFIEAWKNGRLFRVYSWLKNKKGEKKK
jgi:hypothetical protein